MNVYALVLLCQWRPRPVNKYRLKKEVSLTGWSARTQNTFSPAALKNVNRARRDIMKSAAELPGYCRHGFTVSGCLSTSLEPTQGAVCLLNSISRGNPCGKVRPALKTPIVLDATAFIFIFLC